MYYEFISLGCGYHTFSLLPYKTQLCIWLLIIYYTIASKLPRKQNFSGGDGLLAGRLGRGCLRAHPRLGSATPAGPLRYAGITMRVDVCSCRHAGISIPARNAGETNLPSSADGSASGTGPHLARWPPRRGETQYGHTANATNIVPIYYYI